MVKDEGKMTIQNVNERVGIFLANKCLLSFIAFLHAQILSGKIIYDGTLKSERKKERKKKKTAISGGEETTPCCAIDCWRACDLDSSI
jgi:hypothetical protein